MGRIIRRASSLSRRQEGERRGGDKETGTGGQDDKRRGEAQRLKRNVPGTTWFDKLTKRVLSLSKDAEVKLRARVSPKIGARRLRRRRGYAPRERQRARAFSEAREKQRPEPQGPEDKTRKPTSTSRLCGKYLL